MHLLHEFNSLKSKVYTIFNFFYVMFGQSKPFLTMLGVTDQLIMLFIWNLIMVLMLKIALCFRKDLIFCFGQKIS